MTGCFPGETVRMYVEMIFRGTLKPEWSYTLKACQDGFWWLVCLVFALLCAPHNPDSLPSLRLAPRVAV